MRNAFRSLIIAMTLFAPTPAMAEERCFYLADAPLDAPQVRAAADLVFPIARAESPSADTEAAREVFVRTLDGELKSMSRWFAEATPQGRRHDRPNGIAIELEVRTCARGLALFQTYLDRLHEISTDADVSTTLSIFRESARAISAEEYGTVHPPAPTIAMQHN